MPVIRHQIEVHAPIELCFDLSRDVDLHVRSTAQTREVAIGGRTTGLIGPGEEVTWEATHLFVRQRLTSRITAFDRPFHFRDSQVHGAFARFDHDHWFSAVSPKITLMVDAFDYTSPLGPLGRVADVLFLERYMGRFLRLRNELIKRTAEQRSASFV